MSADAIGDQVRNINTRLDNIDRVTSSIDYAVRRFQEVDEACENRIKNIELDFRRSSSRWYSSVYRENSAKRY